jgi:hypothetical protein
MAAVRGDMVALMGEATGTYGSLPLAESPARSLDRFQHLHQGDRRGSLRDMIRLHPHDDSRDPGGCAACPESAKGLRLAMTEPGPIELARPRSVG